MASDGSTGAVDDALLTLTYGFRARQLQFSVIFTSGFTFSSTRKEDIEIHHPSFGGGAWLEDFIECYEFCYEDFVLKKQQPLHDEGFIRVGDIIDHLYWQVDAISTERRRTEINTHDSFLTDLAEGQPIHRRRLSKKRSTLQMKSLENGEQDQGVDSQGVTMITAMIAKL
ncbi:uncharacterized protein N7498_004033 [Penicillium cinerascens]|uniref:Uncharacterized protein n=1 Tax=Penicillium cinerascens TaxID=70096 RepID=A0A9W9T7G6_9EURO|nr:uncharacterized protein N7498_004033 [Penicillium cinerascens]KAJ5212387.1 hypothetical protein N7498_004033 [Penicillium cinerascens]